jgi:cytidylate kinase
MSAIRVVTISRQRGSLGMETGQRLAQLLGWRLAGRDLINQAARNCGLPEMALAVIDELGLLGVRPDAAAQDAYRQAVEGVMGELVGAGQVVIVGRGGQMALHGWPGALHARIIAPLEVRAARLTFRHNISMQAALAQAKASDRARSRYLRLHYQARIDDPNLYDLVINTARLDVEQAARVIFAAVKQGGTSV